MAHKVVYERSGEPAQVVHVVESHASSLLPKELRVEAVGIGRWPAAVSQQHRAWHIGARDINQGEDPS